MVLFTMHLNPKIVEVLPKIEHLFVLISKEDLDKWNNCDCHEKESYVRDFLKTYKNSILSEATEEISKLKCPKEGEVLIANGTKITFVQLKADSYKSGSNLAVYIGESPSETLGCIVTPEIDLEQFIEACILKQAKYESYKTQGVEKNRSTLYINQNRNPELAKEIDLSNILIRCENVLYARRLTNTPANLLRPSDLEREAMELKKLGIEVKVIKGEETKEMGCLRGVGQGSSEEPRLIVLEWMPQNQKDSGESAPVIGLVGKGVTFDSGGYSIKTPSVHMEDMKTDMSGAALVLAVMRASAQLGLKHNLVGCIACVENMISGNAYRPGDILTSLSGKTVEVLNTDAEGRLILADALTYVQRHFRLEYLIDFATLTGAMVVALGEVMCGFFSTDDKLASSLQRAAGETGEQIWRMPLSDEYDKLMDSDMADVKNISGGYGAGSITAAQFLKRFVETDVSWAHFDIAGVAYTKSGNVFSPKYGSGACVRMILQFLSDHCNKI